MLGRILSKLGLARRPAASAVSTALNTPPTMSASDALKKAQEDRIKALKALAVARGLKVSDEDIIKHAQQQQQQQQQQQTKLTTPTSVSNSNNTASSSDATNISQAAASSAAFSSELDRMRTISAQIQEETFQLLMRREELLKELRELDSEENSDADGAASTRIRTAAEEEQMEKQNVSQIAINTLPLLSISSSCHVTY
jgi:hypothetical protein